MLGLFMGLGLRWQAVGPLRPALLAEAGTRLLLESGATLLLE